MKSRPTFEFGYQVVALVVSVILVHAVYVSLIRPRAYADLKREAELRAEQADHVPQRSVYVMIKDVEQEMCFVLLCKSLRQNRALLQYQVLSL